MVGDVLAGARGQQIRVAGRIEGRRHGHEVLVGSDDGPQRNHGAHCFLVAVLVGSHLPVCLEEIVFGPHRIAPSQ